MDGTWEREREIDSEWMALGGENGRWRENGWHYGERTGEGERKDGTWETTVDCQRRNTRRPLAILGVAA